MGDERKLSRVSGELTRPPADSRGAVPDTQSFIIKIWLEERATGIAGSTWRGHITHVPSGVRVYLDSLGDIAAFIRPYLEKMGVRRGVTSWVRTWLRRLLASRSGPDS